MLDITLLKRIWRISDWRKSVARRLRTLERGTDEFEKYHNKAEWCCSKVNTLNGLYALEETNKIVKGEFYVVRSEGVYDRYMILFTPYSDYPGGWNRPMFGVTVWLTEVKSEYTLTVKYDDVVLRSQLLYKADRVLKEVVERDYAPLVDFVRRKQVGFALEKNKGFRYNPATAGDNGKKD